VLAVVCCSVAASTSAVRLSLIVYAAAAATRATLPPTEAKQLKNIQREKKSSNCGKKIFTN
jgi:hypothetical protein